VDFSPIRNVTVDAADPHAQAAFWAAVTGWSVHPDTAPGDEEVLVQAAEDVFPRLLFIRVPEGKTVKNRVHLDVAEATGTRDELVARLQGLGATVYEDHRKPDGTGWVTMLDPEGNEFCVERSAAERA
jgi:predicted enzyme related to lactoylglutathione lyase